MRLIANILRPEYMTDFVIETVDFVKSEALGTTLPFRHNQTRVKFADFVCRVLLLAEVPMPVVTVALVYLGRVRSCLHVRVDEWALEQVFMGALIIAAKVSVPFLSQRRGSIQKHS